MRDTIHAVVVRDGAWYVAECSEVAVVTQAPTLDGLVDALEEALGLHLAGGHRSLRLVMRYDLGRVLTD